MTFELERHCQEADSYRAARVRSMFNCESGSTFRASVAVPLDQPGWRIGLVVGPSGSGKSTLAQEIWPDVRVWEPTWLGRPIIDEIAPESGFDDVPAALSAVGLGSVPTWLRPWSALSNGERFRADLARLIAEQPARAKVDEFTSVVDRQIARVGAAAFGKAWRRTGGQVILFTCHYDVADWLQPCWVVDLGSQQAPAGRSVRPRPPIHLDILETNWRFWPLFEPHHYLKLPRMIGATCYVGLVDGRPVTHVAVSTRPGLVEARACRLVVMPEWQGVGVGLRFLNEVCRHWREGRNRYRLRLTTLFHTSHPGLAAALRRDARWRQVSGELTGSNRLRSIESMSRSTGGRVKAGHGGHLRAVQGFRYYGEAS